MKILILQTGAPVGDLATLFPSYADMIASALGPTFETGVVDVTRRRLPAHDAADGFVITGSPAGVHDGLPWIEEFMAWLRAADAARPLVGVCFGHQAMAHAYGGRVDRAPGGWAVGFHRYRVRRPDLLGRASVSIPALHQDQVLDAPPDAEVVAESDFCPLAALRYRTRRAISIQGHPEFAPTYLDAVIDRRERAGLLTAHSAALARRSVRRGGDDREVVLGWMRRFLCDVTAPLPSP